MSGKHDHSQRTSDRKPGSGHGAFKHTAKPAPLKSVLGAYGLKHADYERVKGLVFSDLNKFHAR